MLLVRPLPLMTVRVAVPIAALLCKAWLETWRESLIAAETCFAGAEHVSDLTLLSRSKEYWAR
jgi:hypothetical protein